MDHPPSTSRARRRWLGTLALALTASAGCTDAYYDYGSAWTYDLVALELPSASTPDYSQYTTFAFNRADLGSGDGGPFTRPFIKAAREELSESLELLGYIEVSVEESPDLVVNFYDQIEERYAYIGGSNYYCWYSWYWYYPCTYYTEHRYKVGTVVVDIVDAGAEDSVWRMVGEGVITDDQRQLDNRVRAAIDYAIDNSPESFLAGPEGT